MEKERDVCVKHADNKVTKYHQWACNMKRMMMSINELTSISARLYAFNPRVIKFRIDCIVAFLEPSSATTTATGFAGFQCAAFGTSGGRRGWFCGHAESAKKGLVRCGVVRCGVG